jgi:DNA-directed RNA polymerase subunit RPC12/RpoP
MNEKRGRPTLHLKLARAAAVSAQAKAPGWKCRPCGAGFEVGSDLADEDAVRCPSCNARLGLARDFRHETPNMAKLRARRSADS